MIGKIADRLLALPRPVKRSLALLVDTAIIYFCVYVLFGLRLERWEFSEPVRRAAAAAVGIALPLFVSFGLYRAVFRYSGAAALKVIAKACAVFGVVYMLIFTFVTFHGVPRSIGLSVPLMLFVCVAASRMFAREWLGARYAGILDREALPQVLIYGVGAAGRALAAALNNSREMVVRGFIDDAPQLQGSTLEGKPIHAPARLADVVLEQGITDLLLAMPSVGRARRAEIVRQVKALGLPLQVRTLPDLVQLAHGRVQVSDLHEVDIEDLLGRDPVPPDETLLHQNITGKVVLVTGAGGSIGSELCRQIVRLQPSALVLVEWNEYALYSIHQELQGEGGDAPPLVPLLASVQDEKRLTDIMCAWRPATVYHAAAYKHVPLVEHNPAEGVRNNVMGTWITARVAAACGVRDFVLISTDKAVRPTNIMGASKRMAEMVLQGLAQLPGSTRFSMVRFGNVLGSSGSVVPLFRRQIRDGGPITLTHPEITRYFMTIPEAAQLVIQAGAMAAGGDVFVLDMGAPVRIIDLARWMVELSGLSLRDEEHPDGDIEIIITGLRPGEKLYEELLIGDNPLPTQHPRVMKARDEAMPWDLLREKLSRLDAAISRGDVEAIRNLLQEVVAGFTPVSPVVDLIESNRRQPAACSE